jgi:hypothetical protein
MFYRCINLEYNNLKEFDENKLENYIDMFMVFQKILLHVLKKILIKIKFLNKYKNTVSYYRLFK